MSHQLKEKRLKQSARFLLCLTSVASILLVSYTAGRTRCGSACDKPDNSNVAHAIRIQQADSAVQDNGYDGLEEHPACIFLRSNAKNQNEVTWGASHRLCMDNTSMIWLQQSRSNCYSCIRPDQNVCKHPPHMLYHMSLDHLHEEVPEANLLSIQAYLMTQDLTKSKLILWALDPSRVYTSKSAWLFDSFSNFISIQQFDYDREVIGTPWEGDPFFGRESTVKEHVTNPACFSDLVRMIVLHKHGGLWMDSDVLFYQDLTHLLLTSYQFVMRWTNNHILRMEAGSRLTHRWLELAKTMPMNHPEFKEEIIDKLCDPIGYYQLVPDKYKYMDIYNGCLLRLLMRHNNTGPSDAVLYDMPLGWWDHDWAGCFNFGSRDAVDDDSWHQLASTYFAMHSRYPGDTDRGPDNSPLNRVVRIIHGFFRVCKNAHCLPLQGLPLLAYEKINAIPPEAL